MRTDYVVVDDTMDGRTRTNEWMDGWTDGIISKLSFKVWNVGMKANSTMRAFAQTPNNTFQMFKVSLTRGTMELAERHCCMNDIKSAQCNQPWHSSTSVIRCHHAGPIRNPTHSTTQICIKRQTKQTETQNKWAETETIEMIQTIETAF